MDAKIDMLHRTGAIGKPAIAPSSSQEPPSEALDDIDEEDEVERSIVSGTPLPRLLTIL